MHADREMSIPIIGGLLVGIIVIVYLIILAESDLRKKELTEK